MTGTGQRVPRFAVIGNHDTSSLRVADESITVDDEVNAVGILRIIHDGTRAHVELDVAAGHAEGDAGGNITVKELRRVAGRLDVGVVGVQRTPAEAVVAGKLSDGQIAGNGCRVAAFLDLDVRSREVHSHIAVDSDRGIVRLRLDCVKAVVIDRNGGADSRVTAGIIGHEINTRASDGSNRSNGLAIHFFRNDIERKDVGIVARILGRAIGAVDGIIGAGAGFLEVHILLRGGCGVVRITESQGDARDGDGIAHVTGCGKRRSTQSEYHDECQHESNDFLCFHNLFSF